MGKVQQKCGNQTLQLPLYMLYTNSGRGKQSIAKEKKTSLTLNFVPQINKHCTSTSSVHFCQGRYFAHNNINAFTSFIKYQLYSCFLLLERQKLLNILVLIIVLNLLLQKPIVLDLKLICLCFRLADCCFNYEVIKGICTGKSPVLERFNLKDACFWNFFSSEIN